MTNGAVFYTLILPDVKVIGGLTLSYHVTMNASLKLHLYTMILKQSFSESTLQAHCREMQKCIHCRLENVEVVLIGFVFPTCCAAKGPEWDIPCGELSAAKVKTFGDQKRKEQLHIGETRQ